MKLYCDKTRARYAAKRELAKGNLNAEPREGVDFEIVAQDGKFAWVVPAPVQAPVTDFLEYPEAGGDAAEARAARKPRKAKVPTKFRGPVTAALPAAQTEYDFKGYKLRVASVEPPKVQVFDPRFSGPAADYETTSLDLAMAWVNAYRDGVVWAVQAKLSPASEPAAEDLPKPAPELPTAFTPDAAAGEIASAEYGMLLTRERAGEAAKAAGVSDPVISQTARGMWVWRTPALNTVWRESQKPPKQPVTLSAAAAPKAGKAKAANGRRGGSKLDIAEALLRRPEGATPEEVAAQVDGWDARSAKIRIGTCLKLTRKLSIVCEVEEGRGRVYRIAA